MLSLGDIRSVSVTRFSDGLLALHLKEVPGEGGPWGPRGSPVGLTPPISPQTSTGGAKGDFLLISDHLIELITRLHQTLMDATAQALPLHITDEYGWGGGRGYQGWGEACGGEACKGGASAGRS